MHPPLRYGSPRVRSTVLILALLLFAGTGAAQPVTDVPELDPEQILAYQGGVTLSQQEIDAVFNKLPASERLLFVRDGGKVDQLINSLLQRKLIAREAVAAGYDKDPLMAARLELEQQKVLAEAWMEKYLEDAPAADFEALAYEHYLANPEAYRSDEILDVSHILIGIESRGISEARELAASLRMQLEEEPTRFDDLVAEYSDDPLKQNNGGRYAEMSRGMMVGPFERAAFKLEQVGDISEPVETQYGFHIIRLNGRAGNELQEYGEVRDQAVADARRRYLDNYRHIYLTKLLSDPVVIPDGAVEVMAKRHFGENLERAPDYAQ